MPNIPPCAACDHCVLVFSSGRTVRACALVPGGVLEAVDEVDGTSRTVVEQGALCEQCRGTDACEFSCEQLMRKRRRLVRAQAACHAVGIASAITMLALLLLANSAPLAVLLALAAVAVLCVLAASTAERALADRGEPGVLSIEERAGLARSWRGVRKDRS